MKLKRLLEKIWKCLGTLAILFGLLSITNIIITIYVWTSIIFLTICISLYWHLLELIDSSKKEIIEQFINKKDLIEKYQENGQEKIN